jgi:hypothetical protein
MITKRDLLNEWLAQACLELGNYFHGEVVKFETFGQGTSFEIHIGEFRYKNFNLDVPNMGKIFFAGRKPEIYLANKVISDYHLTKVHNFKYLAEQELIDPPTC